MALLTAFQWLWTMGIVAGFSTEFPNPQKEFRLCGRRNASFVCDPEFILDIGDASIALIYRALIIIIKCNREKNNFHFTVERLNQLALDFRKSTACLCSRCDTGISLGIFIRSSLSQEAEKEYQSGKNVAEMLRKRWHLGKCNDDIVIIILTEMNISEYSMGSAVKAIFPDETAGLILKDCKIHFLSGWYYQGLESVVTSFNDVLIKIQKEKKSFSKSLIIGLSLGTGVLLILLIFSLIVLRRQNKRRKKGCSNIYESVPTKSNNHHFLNENVNKYQQEKLHKQDSENEEESDDDNTLSRQFLQIKRQLSAVVEESDDNEGLRENVCFSKATLLPQSTHGSLQVTEL